MALERFFLQSYDIHAALHKAGFAIVPDVHIKFIELDWPPTAQNRAKLATRENWCLISQTVPSKSHVFADHAEIEEAIQHAISAIANNKGNGRTVCHVALYRGAGYGNRQKEYVRLSMAIALTEKSNL